MPDLIGFFRKNPALAGLEQMISFSRSRRFPALLLGLAFLHSTQASVINWESPLSVNSISDIATSGTFFAAKSGYAVSQDNGPVTIGSVAFGDASEVNITFGGNTGFSLVGPPVNTGNADYNNMLGTGYFSIVNAASTITLGGLTSGNTYRVQLWVPVWDMTWATSFSSGSSVDLGNTYNQPRYVIGSFTADSTTQTISYYGTADSPYGLVAAASVFTTAAVPEPGAWGGIMGAGLLAVAFLRRRFKPAD